ncbi:hypothetical protein LJR231_001956 [Phyllobacterium sp. LjRoot231]|uniref:hypothetical protein n=1 Tax=Phyllobacterium sp. LjRoot231 TaxID=3342289 RepID=UPI003ED06C9D
MTAHTPIDIDILASVRTEAARHSYHPRGTVRCVGVPLFRNTLARECACLLDFDPDILSWSCLPLELTDKKSFHVPDFRIERSTGPALVDVFQSLDDASVRWIKERALVAGFQHEFVLEKHINSGFRLRNAQDLLRYARWRTPLGDRLRLLAALDEQGSMTVSECLTAFRETLPIAGLASLILHRFLEIELDDELINPDTTVRRRRG